MTTTTFKLTDLVHKMRTSPKREVVFATSEYNKMIECIRPCIGPAKDVVITVDNNLTSTMLLAELFAILTTLEEYKGRSGTIYFQFKNGKRVALDL